jgi:peptide/nickel transport system substrate-binding protein
MVESPPEIESSEGFGIVTGFWVKSLWLALALAFGASGAVAQPTYGIAMHGSPALPADYRHFPYVNPEAPKGGSITYGVTGSFDSINPFIVKGASARGIWDVSLGNNVFESLLVRNRAEPFTLYGLLAESVEMPDDRSSVTFNLNPKAKFSDGKPVTPEDVLFTLRLLRDKGRPNYKSWYDKIATAEQVGEHGIKLTFKDTSDRELPLLLGLMPILPKHAIDEEHFDQSTLKPMIGSGPYTIAEVSAPTRIVLKRDPNYWGKDLPSKVGFDNFDTLIVEYYRDKNSLFEAFKKGLYDVRPEDDPSLWESGYDFPAAKEGRVVREEFTNGNPKPMLGFIFNTRRKMFSDVRVRKALASLFDFEWINRNLYFGIYSRTGSFFEGSELSALGRPASAAERALLAPFAGKVEKSVLDGTYAPVKSDGSGGDRKVLRAAVDLLAAAGYRLNGDRMVGPDGKPFEFEFLATERETERLALAYSRTLARIGIGMTIRSVDSAQYERRVQSFDFDMIQNAFPSSLSPGNEQSFRWSSAAADADGSFNFAGVKDPAIDAMLGHLLAARSREEFVDAVRALDRLLISGNYVVPLFHLPKQWVARWSRIKHPDATPITGYQFSTWWSDS